MADTPLSDNADDEVVELDPSYALKDKIGMNMNQILTDEVVKDSQKVIHKSQKDFLKWIEADLQTLENAYNALAADPENGRDPALIIQKSAFTCKSQAGTFGYDLGSAIAKSLYDFLEKDYVEGERGHVIIIRKHIDTLNTIFHRKVEGDGGKIGNAVYGALGKLIKKYEVA
ncbi:MAG: hypothetical protein MK052_02290 [Alphaproteobacteria bacterium]|nr:hypothetical protein [Alphaproteobacteria bacterium]